jgi:hypothetical protein
VNRSARTGAVRNRGGSGDQPERAQLGGCRLRVTPAPTAPLSSPPAFPPTPGPDTRTSPVYVVAKDSSGGGAAKSAAAATWDGKTTFECGGNDAVTLTGVTATAAVKAGGNCQLTMTGVSITAPVAIDASGNAKVIMTGGSITSSTSSVVASANAKVDLVGTKVSGKSKASGGAKITGAP